MNKLAGMNTSTPTSAPTFRNPTKSEIPGLLAELDASTEPVAQFARKRGLKPQALYIALRRLKPKEAPAPVFDRVRIAEPVPTTSPFELRLKSGIRLAIPPTFEAPALSLSLLPLWHRRTGCLLLQGSRLLSFLRR